MQVASYDMVRLGDWIVLPKYGADGDVIEISLNTVKVQNFDKTIVTVPTPALLNSGMTNWRGMSESGGRRIKRHINIDVDSIRFADDALIEHLKGVCHLRNYIDERDTEINTYNTGE